MVLYVAALLAAAYVWGEVGDTQAPLPPAEMSIFVALAFGSSVLAGAKIGVLALSGPPAALVVIFGLYWLGAPLDTFESDPLWGLGAVLLGLAEGCAVVLGVGLAALGRARRPKRRV